MKRISILGSTGSIGTQTLEIIRADRELRLVALAALKNTEKLLEETREFMPSLVCVYDREKAEEFKAMLSGAGISGVRVVSGMEGLCEAASFPEADTVMVSVVGMIGIRPTIAAIEAGKHIALANKETLVTAGHLIMPMVKEKGIQLMPVDSEHSAIYQCLHGERKRDLEKILLTCSGGPFRGYTKEAIRKVTAADALRHPNWSMGPKITVDCSTLVNKALEVMEAHWLFDVPISGIQVVIQPKSVIHSMIQTIDGAVIAQLGVPSMLIPIEYAVYETERHRLPHEEKLDFTKLKSIEFDVPDTDVFPGLSLGIRAGETGGSMPTVFNAANEETVAMFLRDEIGFTEITDGIEKAMNAHTVIENPSLSEIFETEKEARSFIREYFKK